jgi:Pyridoxamine 5'-phosphate oxidase
MHWHDVQARQPQLAELGERMLGNPGVVLVGTIRRDGTPRISPVEPLFWRSDLWLSMGWATRKAADLQRDPRILVHSIVTSRDGTAGEYKVRGRAESEQDPQLLQQYARAVTERLGWAPEVGRFHLFRVDVAEVSFIRWDDANNDQYVTRWPGGREFVRRGTSATSNGPPEPCSALLVSPSA